MFQKTAAWRRMVRSFLPPMVCGRCVLVHAVWRIVYMVLAVDSLIIV